MLPYLYLEIKFILWQKCYGATHAIKHEALLF